MIGFLLALAIPAMGQMSQATQALPIGVQSSTPSPVDQSRVDAIDLAIQSLQSGKPIITGTPNFQQGIKFSSSSTSPTYDITFRDGSGMNTAVSAASYGPSIYTSSITASSVISNGRTVVLNSSYTAATAAWLYLFSTSMTYVVHYNVNPSASGATFQLDVNGASTASSINYDDSCESTQGSDRSWRSQGSTIWKISGSDGIYNGIDGMQGSFLMEFDNQNKYLTGHGGENRYASNGASTTSTGCKGEYFSRQGGLPTQDTDGHYSIKFSMDSGTFTGRIWVEQTTFPQAY